MRHSIPNLHSPISVPLITLFAFAIRLLLLNTHPLRQDEAIYGYWALHLLHEDPWFLTVWPDKPPLFLWLLAGMFSLIGESAASGRFLNIMLSTATIPVVAATACHLWGKQAGWVAALAMALNPFAISFSATVFTDPLLVFTGSLALYMALTRRSFGAGLWLAAAIMSKQQGVLYAPLVIGVWFLALRQERGRRGEGEGDSGREGEREKAHATHHSALIPYYVAFIAGFMLITAPILLWDSQRWAVAPSPWDWSVRNYAPLQLVPIPEWFQRAQQWGDQLWYLTASWPLWVLLIGASLWLINRDWEVAWKQNTGFYGRFFRQSEVRDGRSGSKEHPILLSPGLLTLWSFAFIILHIIITLQVWDRYLLPLAPMLSLGIASCELQVARHLSQRFNLHSSISSLLLPLLFLALLAPPAWSAARGQLPIGGDHGDYAGLDEAIDWVEQRALMGTVAHRSGSTELVIRNSHYILYQRTLGWHYRFYLYQQVAEGRVELRWFPSPAYLADNASKAPHLSKFLIEPYWSLTPNLAFHLRSRGHLLKLQQVVGNFTIFEIIQLPQPACDWCFSGERSPFPALTLTNSPAMMCTP